MSKKRQIWSSNILAAVFMLLLALPVTMKSLHHHEHGHGDIDKKTCTVSAKCATCELLYTRLSPALSVPLCESPLPRFFALSVRHSFIAPSPGLALPSVDRGRAPPVAI